MEGNNMQEKELEIKKTNNETIPSQNELMILQTVARNAANSGLYSGVGGENKIFMILLAAKELGIPPMAALNGGLWNIQGKVEISARMINAMMRRAGIKITVKRLDAKGCILEGTRPDSGDTCEAKFLEEDAARAGVINRGPWKQNPEDMYFARAISKLGRRLAPDILGTAYVEGEIRDAKCEIIETIAEEKEPENPEVAEQLIIEHVREYLPEDQEMMKTYLKKYSQHWKKTIKDTLFDYQNREKFETDFAKWKIKELAKAA